VTIDGGDPEIGPPRTGPSDALERITDRLACKRLHKDGEEILEDTVPVEEPMSIIVNGRHAVDATISPHRIKEFVIGHLVCEGQIAGPEDIESYSEWPGRVEVRLRGEPKQSAMRSMIFNGCFGGSGERPPLPEKIGKVDSDLALGYEQVQRAIEAIEDSPVHRLTGGVHTCGIFLVPEVGSRDAPHLVAQCDDIGRHNALDKAVGEAVMQGCPLARCFVVTTGRASSEMVAKCHAAGIPVLASRGATTTLAVEIARLSGIALIGFARKGRISLYSNEWRVVGSRSDTPEPS